MIDIGPVIVLALSSELLATFSSHPAVDPIRLTKTQLRNPSVVGKLSDYAREHVEDFRLHRWIRKLVGNDGIRQRPCGVCIVISLSRRDFW